MSLSNKDSKPRMRILDMAEWEIYTAAEDF